MFFWIILSVGDWKSPIYLVNDLYFLYTRHEIIWNVFNELWQD